MADLTRTIEILFNGTNRTGTAIKGVGDDLGKLNYAVGSVAAPFASVTDAVVKLDAALAALAVAGIAYSVTKFGEFQDVMLKVQGIMGASGAEAETLTNLTKDLGATTRYTATEAAQGLEFLAMAGLGYEKSIVALPEVLKLAQASATDLGRTADLITNIMSGYGIAADDLVKTSDVLTATFTNANTNLEELGQAYKYVGPVAKAMGLEIEETSAILGVLANAGYKAEQGGTALRNILIALVAPASGASKLLKEMGVNTEELGVDLASSKDALQSLGVSVQDANGDLRNMPDILADLARGLGTIESSADRTAVLVSIFGKRGGPQMAALLEQGSTAVTGMETKIRSLGGVTDKIATQMESGIGGALRTIKSAFESVTLEIGENFADGLIDPVTGVVTFLREMKVQVGAGAFDPIFDAFDNFGDEIRANMEGIAAALPEALEGVDWSGLLDAFGDLRKTIGGLFDGIDLSDSADLEKAIQDVIDTLASLVKFSSGIAGVFVDVAREIKGLVDGFNNLDDETKRTMGSVAGIGKVISSLTGPFGQLAGGIKAIGLAMEVMAAGNIVKLVAGFVGPTGLVSAMTSVGGAIATMSAAILASPLAAGTAAGVLGYGIGTAFREAIPAIDDAAQSVLGFIDKHTGLLGVHDQQQKNEEDWQAIQARWSAIQADRGEAAQAAGTDFTAMVKQVESAGQGTEWLTEKMRELGILVTADMKVNIDTKDAQANLQKLEYWVGDPADGPRELRTLWVPVDTKSVDAAKKKIEEIPAVKKLEFETDIEVAKIQAESEKVQSFFEWRATVDVAEVEASAKIIESISQGLSDSFAGTGEQILGLFSALEGAGSISAKWKVEDQIRAESERRDAVLDQQKALNQAEIDYLKAKTDRVKSDDAIIKVSGDGLQPHLEAIMWDLLAAIQVRASNEGLNSVILGV